MFLNPRMISTYYAATVLFLLLDVVFGVNIRLAFFEDHQALKVAYYLLCFLLFALTLRFPQWSIWIGIGESLLSLSLLIITMALRVVIVSDEMIEHGRGYPSLSEIVNFGISGLVVYLGYVQRLKAVRTKK